MLFCSKFSVISGASSYKKQLNFNLFSETIFKQFKNPAKNHFSMVSGCQEPVRSTDLNALDSKETINFIYGACEKDFFTASLNI